jgi:hypothetical protein
VTSQVPTGKILCPNCGQPATSADAVYHEGIAHTSGYSSYSGTGRNQGSVTHYHGGSDYTGDTITGLAGLLQPPQEPQCPSAWGCASSISLLFSFFCCGAFPFLGASNKLSSGWIVVLTFIGLAVMVIMIAFISLNANHYQKEINREFEPIRKRYEFAMYNWHQMFYCRYDHGVFLFNQRRWVPVNQKNAIL